MNIGIVLEAQASAAATTHAPKSLALNIDEISVYNGLCACLLLGPGAL